MNLVQLTPGAGGMYCGNCFRDNALIAELRRQGHQALMVPLYLPMTVDEADQTAGTPIFYGGVSVYLEQKSSLLRRAPRWLHQLLASPTILNWAGKRAANTRAKDLGELTLSMLRGEEGNQARELNELLEWLKSQPQPDVICLSNSLLLGLARKLRQELQVPIVCYLQGEDGFIDAMGEHSEAVWQLMTDRAREVDLFIAPSRYFGDLMAKRLSIPAAKIRVIYNGINLDGFTANPLLAEPPTLGFFARMCPAKGLDTLVDAFLQLKKTSRIPFLRLKVGGGCGTNDAPFVAKLRRLLESRGHSGDVSFHPNIDRNSKIEFLRSLSALSVPARFGEPFGFYVLEAMAAGVPVVQPKCASFPELIAATGGGICFEPSTAESLAASLESLLSKPAQAKAMGLAGRESVRRLFSIETMANNIVSAMQEIVRKPSAN